MCAHTGEIQSHDMCTCQINFSPDLFQSIMYKILSALNAVSSRLHGSEACPCEASYPDPLGTQLLSIDVPPSSRAFPSGCGQELMGLVYNLRSAPDFSQSTYSYEMTLLLSYSSESQKYQMKVSAVVAASGSCG